MNVADSADAEALDEAHHDPDFIAAIRQPIAVVGLTARPATHRVAPVVPHDLLR